jgi:hypothetical protein
MNPKICYIHLWRNGEIIAASSENPQSPAEGTQETSREFATRTIAGDLAETWDVDLGEAKEYNFIGILGHNLTSGATIQIIGADDDAFSVNAVTDTLTHVGNDLWEILGTARTKRYLRLSVSDASNPDNYLEIGPVIVGKAVELSRGHSSPYQRGAEDQSVVELTPALVSLVTDSRGSLKVWGLQFGGLSEASLAAIRELLETVGIKPAFALCFDPSVPNGNTYWVRIRESDLPEHGHPDYGAWSVTLEEVR